MKDRFLLDSSIWIELERQNRTIGERVIPLIEKNRVCLADVIVAEVLRGCRTQKDFHTLQKSFENFRWLSTSWMRVANLGFKISKKGFQPPLIDLYIAQCTIENKVTLITQDKHFAQIAKSHSFSYELFPV